MTQRIFTVETSQVQGLQDSLQELRSLRILPIYKRFYAYYREKTASRYMRVSRETPYSPNSLGRRKKKSGEIITNSSLFGIDGWDVYTDVTKNVRITANGIEIWTDQEYAAELFERFETKGPFAPDGVLFADQEDQDYMTELIEEGVAQIFV